MLKRWNIACGVAAISMICAAAAKSSGPPSPNHYEVIRGAVQVESAPGNWSNSDTVPVGAWCRSSDNNATLHLPGGVVRLGAGSMVKVDSDATINAKHGRIFVKVAEGSSYTVVSAQGVVKASGSEFIVDASDAGKVRVVEGEAAVSGAPKWSPLRVWAKDSKVALDGPDVRVRNRNRKRFTQGEENKGKRIGEDAPPSSSPTPPTTSSPAYTPSPSPSFTPPSPSASASPPPSNNNPPPQADGGGGGNAFDILGPVLGAGAIAGVVVLVNNNNDNNDNNFIAQPISP